MPTASAETSRGLLYTLISYTLWGFLFPVYMKALHHVPPLVIVSHRVVWSLPVAVLILVWLGTLRPTLAKFRSPRVVGLAAVTASLITVNWGTYVYAIVAGHAVEAALGYYINPLVNVLLAAVFLGERPNRPQVAAILLAAAAVLILTVQAGGLPWISIVLALSFGSYGLLRKMLPIGPAEGFFMEVALLALPALALMASAVPEGSRHYLPHGAELWLLFGAGPLTALPLILFAAGAKRLDFATLGILQYMVPTLLFLCAVTLFGEPFSRWQLVAFALIWTSVAIYVWTLLRGGTARRRPAADAAREIAGAT